VTDLVQQALERARAAVARSAVTVAARRRDVGRRLAFGLEVSPADLESLCSAPPDVALLEAEVRRWSELRGAMVLVRELPALRARQAAWHARVNAEMQRYASEQDANRGLVYTAERAALELEQRKAHQKVIGKGFPESSTLSAAQSAWAKVLSLIDPARVQAHNEREAALSRARDRVARAEAALADAEGKGFVTRIKEALAAALSRADREPSEIADVRVRKVRAQLAEEDTDERHTVRVGPARAEAKAAREELEAIAAKPELLEELLMEFAQYEAEAQGPAEPEAAPETARRPKARAKA
jgi:hypothetical protein